MPNLYKVSDTLYRGTQPEEVGFASLKKLCIKTVINLRSLHSDRSECVKNGLDYVKITAQGWSKEEAIKERTEGGFGYHSIWKGLIEYIRDLDVDALKRQIESD